MNENIVVTQKTESRGRFSAIETLYEVRVFIDGSMHPVFEEFHTWNEAYRAGEKYLRKHESDMAWSKFLTSHNTLLHIPNI